MMKIAASQVMHISEAITVLRMLGIEWDRVDDEFGHFYSEGLCVARFTDYARTLHVKEQDDE